MSRNRSHSTSSSTSPALISRGFASIRRAHRRLSTSSPSSPNLSTGDNSDTHTNETTPTVTPTPLSIPSPAQPSPADSESATNTIVRPRIRLVPNVGLSSRSFVFEIVDRELEPGVRYRIGRFSDRNIVSERLSFKSKVVSRNHAELWAENGKVFIRDIGSSSGTFLNRIRLSAPNQTSEPYEIKDGDAIQLGVDYQGGLEPIYRAVRIRVEINRQIQNPNSPFTRTAFQQLRSHLIGAPSTNNTSNYGSPPPTVDLIGPIMTDNLGLCREATKVPDHNTSDIESTSDPAPVKDVPLSEMMSRHHITDMSRADIQECCICLYAIAPFQALFIAPCSHIFHFKCLRPIVFQNYPGFSCPLCRNYFDLEASVSIEVDDVLEAISIAKEKQQKEQLQLQSKPIDTVPELNEDEENDTYHPETSASATAAAAVAEESPAQPADNQNVEQNNSNEQEEEETSSQNKSYTPTLPIPQLNIADELIDSEPENDQNSQSEANRNNRAGEALLSSTLVGSPTFRRDVLSSSSSRDDTVS
ncbi:hypothetical protein BD770DRAFT_438648 [Pilaira anomala]|nr:hypothetical protein BD770DRAFT_438648 [Pilaira anomala]